MNTEILNRWGGHFLNLAWPMLWQSSVLIGLIFILDLALRRKVRAAVRHALWLVVLVKLMLPPTLALPTSPSWWIHSPAPPPATTRAIPFTVTYGEQTMPDFQMPLPPIPVQKRPALSFAAWTLILSSIVSAGLLAWLLVRWRYVVRKIQVASSTEELNNLLNESARLAGLRSTIRLKLTEDSMSPVVCGLFRPVILLPQSLVKKLSAEQLRAVLLHELIHLRRGDVWMNCAQALLQIVYWWHPLLWLANARIRRVREEAVDDAVMLALRDDAEIYAPTLLEVAKFAFRRPLASLGLVGILESRSALRQRIERLVDFNAPRRTGLTVVSILGILAFSAVALPMGEAPASKDNSFSTDTNLLESKTLTVKVNPGIFVQNVKAQARKSMLSPTNDYTAILLEVLRSEGVDWGPPHGIAFHTKTGEITTQNTPDELEIFRQVIEQLNRADGKCELPLRSNFHRKSVVIDARIYQLRAADFDKIVSGLDFYRGNQSGDLWWSASPVKFPQFLDYLKSSGLRLISRPRIQTGSGMPAEFYVGNGTNSVDFECKPFAGEGFVDLRMHGTIIAKAAFTNYFNVEASAQNGGGIVIRMENSDGYAESNLLVVINLETITNTARLQQGLAPVPTNAVQGILSDTNFQARIHALEQRTGVETLAEPEAITTSGRQVQLRSANTVKQADYTPASGNDASSTNVTTFKIDHPMKEDDLKKLFLDAGVKIPPTVFIQGGRNGILLVRGSDEQLGLVEQVVLKLNGFAPNKGKTNHPAGRTSITTSANLAANNLEQRVFKLDPHSFSFNLRDIHGVQSNNIAAMTESLFTKLGVDLTAPGRGITYNDKLGLLFVKGTASELDSVERVVQTLNQFNPQIHIKARFIAVPKKGFVMPQSITNATAGQLTGILSDPQFRTVLYTLEHQNGVEQLAEPECVTTSGRKTMMRATLIQMIVTNFVFQEKLTGSTNNMPQIGPQIGKIETGPAVDVVPWVLSDGYTIDLTATASMLEFLGYDSATNTIYVTNNVSRRFSVPTVRPGFRIQKGQATVNLSDNQTLVLGNLKNVFVVGDDQINNESKFIQEAEKKNGTADKELLVFITATIVDPAGNRVHSDDELPFNPTTIPPQPKISSPSR